jgi:hypothetical protein
MSAFVLLLLIDKELPEKLTLLENPGPITKARPRFYHYDLSGKLDNDLACQRGKRCA